MSGARDEAVWRRAGRRLLTVPLYLALAPLSVLSAPVWVPLTLLVDASRQGPRAALRCGVFFVLYLHCELFGILASFAVWLARPATGPDGHREWNYRLQRLWARALFEGAARIFGFRVTVEGREAVARSPMLLFVRHASVADTLLPANLIEGTRLRYVLKRELLWDPCLDIVGNRLPNYFVRRGAEDGEREIAAVGRLVRGIGPGEGALSFPEGTRFTAAKRERILARLRASGDAEARVRAERLRHVLPPRLGGTLAMLEHDPGADVVFCAHAGFEGAGSFWDLWRGALVDREVRVRFWRVPYAEIPEERGARIAWLHEHWARMDAWIDACRTAERGDAAAHAG